MKTRSVKKLFKASFLVTVLLLIILTFAYGIYSVQISASQILNHTASSLEKYTATLSEELDTLKEFNRNLVYSNPSFQLLTLDNYPDSKRVVERYNLRQIMMYYTPSFGATMLYDSHEDAAYFVYGTDLTINGGQTLPRNAFFHEMGQTPEDFGFSRSNEWFIASDSYDDAFLVIANNNNSRAMLFSCLNIRAYLKHNPVPVYSDKSNIVIFSSQTPLIGREYVAEQELELSSLHSGTSNLIEILRSGHVIHTVTMDRFPIAISVITPVSELISPVLPQIIFFILVDLLVVAIILIVYKVLSRFMVFPLQEIAALSQQLDASEQDQITLPESTYQEYNDIRRSLTDLLEKNAALELEKQSKEFEKEHALLQYFQLQTRSHFFLNCLKSLYSMLENREHTRMKTMILGFSNHMRFIFHDNTSVVTLESELKEVNDYHRIILLDYSRIFLVNQDVPEDLLDCKVPPLIIQTFLENTYKYNDKTGSPLTFNIRVSKIGNENGDYLQIHLSDNGCGYRSEVLEKINGEPSGTFDQYNVGINNLKRRMAIVYKDDFHAAFYNLPSGGACSVLFVPVKK